MSGTPFGMLNFRFIYFRGEQYDYKTINAAIDNLAKFLRSNFTSTSPFVILTAYNHIKTLIAFYAILRAGKIVVVLDPEWREMEVAEVIEDVQPAAMIFLNNSTSNFNYDEEFVFKTDNRAFIIGSDLRDVCLVAYTNAEDGYSKGAMLTRENLLTELHTIVEANHLNENSVMYSLLPFSHLYGLVLGVMVSTLSGGSAIISELNMLKIQDTLNYIKCYHVTHFYSVPSIYYIIAKYTGIEDLFKNVKMCISGGTKLTPFVFDTFLKKTDKIIHEGYGLTETSPACTFNFDEDAPNVESVGKPLAHSDIRIFDSDFNECTPDKIGEICIKGDLVFKGYFNKQEATEEVIKNGWLHTGDYGKKDKEGFIYFCGLKKSMINVAGVKVYPKKLERMIKVNENVLDARVFSEESLLQGQIVGSRIKLKNSSLEEQNALKKWCSEKINNALLPRVWIFE
jgi:long-chain acyl-CoA synthetase